MDQVAVSHWDPFLILNILFLIVNLIIFRINSLLGKENRTLARTYKEGLERLQERFNIKT